MALNSLEEMHLYSQFFGARTLAFIRTAENTVILFSNSEPIAVMKIEDQLRLVSWLERRVAETT